MNENEIVEPTPEQWARWAKYKSNKDLYIERQEYLLECEDIDD